MKIESNPNPNLVLPPVIEKVKNFYDIGSPYYVKMFGSNIHDGYYTTGKESREEAQEALIKFLAEKAGIKNGDRILDVGCGVGGSSVWLAKNLQATTVGITVSPVQLEMARRLAREQKANSSFLLMNAERMEFAEPFDIMWVVAALTHFPHQKQFLESTSRFLKKNGKLIIFDWTVNKDLTDITHDKDVQAVREGMLMAAIFSNETYVHWLIEDGFKVTDEEDITTKTIKTWDINLSIIRRPLVKELIMAVVRGEMSEIRTFMQARSAIKLAMQKGKVKSWVIIAEKSEAAICDIISTDEGIRTRPVRADR